MADVVKLMDICQLKHHFKAKNANDGNECDGLLRLPSMFAFTAVDRSSKTSFDVFSIDHSNVTN